MQTPPDASQFVEFGDILDREKRKRLVEYLEKRIRREKVDQFAYNDLQPYASQIDAIFSYREALDAVSEHDAIANQVTSEILALLQDSRKKFKATNPNASEAESLSNWRGKSPEEMLESASELFADVRKVYTEKEFSLGFYEKRIREESKALRKDKPKLGALMDSLLDEWSRRLLEKEMAYELSIIESERAEYCKRLYERIEMFRKLITVLQPLTNELGRLWDLSSSVWQRTNLDILTRYAEFLEREESIKQLAEMLGRMDSAERELQEKERSEKVFETEWRTTHASKAELVGIHESDDLSNLLPTEVALLAGKSTEPYFFKKFAEKKLMTWEYEAQILAEKETLVKRRKPDPKKKEKGPVIICVDTSGSMHGEPETIAKTMAFAILRIALRDSRPCYLISFSTGIQTLKLNDLRKSLERLLDFLGMSFHGGTDPEPALKEALRQMKESQYKDADLLVISDFIMDSLPDKMVKEIEEARKLKNRFHSLVISSSANPKVLSAFDNNWLYDLSGPTRVTELVMDVKMVTAGKSIS